MFTTNFCLVFINTCKALFIKDFLVTITSHNRRVSWQPLLIAFLMVLCVVLSSDRKPIERS